MMPGLVHCADSAIAEARAIPWPLRPTAPVKAMPDHHRTGRLHQSSGTITPEMVMDAIAFRDVWRTKSDLMSCLSTSGKKGLPPNAHLQNQNLVHLVLRRCQLRCWSPCLDDHWALPPWEVEADHWLRERSAKDASQIGFENFEHWSPPCGDVHVKV